MKLTHVTSWLKTTTSHGKKVWKECWYPITNHGRLNSRDTMVIHSAAVKYSLRSKKWTMSRTCLDLHCCIRVRSWMWGKRSENSLIGHQCKRMWVQSWKLLSRYGVDRMGKWVSISRMKEGQGLGTMCWISRKHYGVCFRVWRKEVLRWASELKLQASPQTSRSTTTPLTHAQ